MRKVKKHPVAYVHTIVVRLNEKEQGRQRSADVIGVE